MQSEEYSNTLVVLIKKMKRYFTILFLIISMGSYSQPISNSLVSKKDSLINAYIQISFEDAKQGNCDSAIISITNAINIDSTYFELYYLRGAFYNLKCFPDNDSLVRKHSINDFYKCIVLKTTTTKTFPDTALTNSIFHDSDARPTGDLGDMISFFTSYALLRGVATYLKSEGIDKKVYCMEWQNAIKEGMPEAKKLIDIFCR
jgi:hypothetical protein